MKKFLAVLALVGLAIPAFAQLALPEHQFASGKWSFVGARLLQNDGKAPLAKANFKVPQNGRFAIAFNALYEGGAEDGHGGFGVHLFADRVHSGASWGNGNSYLLWLNYDEKPKNPEIQKGFSAQIYRSTSHSQMRLVQSVDLNQYAHLVTPENLAAPLPIRITADTASGEVRIYDPTDPSNYFYFNIDKKDIPMNGSWVSLRTNGLKMSFALMD
jgi:hypothetical protein